MSSPTTSPPTAGSTSTPAIASNWSKATKVPLRKKGATLQAVKVLTAQMITLPDETLKAARVGDWLVMQGSIVIAVITDAAFPGPYEIVLEGTLVLGPYDRDKLEELTGLGTTRSAADLVAAINRLARIRIGDVQVQFTPGQLEELKTRADKRNQTVLQAMQAVVDRIKDELFWKG